MLCLSWKGLGYKSPEPIRITGKSKTEVVDDNYIITEEVDDSKETEQRAFVLDNIKHLTTHSSVSQRLGMTKTKEEDQCLATIST